MDKTKLEETTRKWKELGRKTEEQRKKAEDFYDRNLMGLIEKRFIENNKEKLTERVEYLIMSVGTSYEPLVLSISLLKPGKILFLYTEKTKSVLNKIMEYCRLSVSNVEMQRVDVTDPTSIYREIKRAYLEWNRPEKVYIDFTGGTKAMSAAAAMAGSVIGVQLVYVGSEDYLTDFRKPEPGSEMLYFITNPLDVFGDMEIEKAIALFAQNNYSGAAEKLEFLKEQVPDPALRQQLNFVYLLARSYEAWDALEFERAHDNMARLTGELERDRGLYQTFWLMDMLEDLKKQKKLLDSMLVIPKMSAEKRQMEIFGERDCLVALMFTIYQNAYVREKQEKYDMAALLMYRLLEMIEQKRLANYGLDVSHMEYDKIPYEKCGLPEVAALAGNDRREWLKRQLQALKGRMFRTTGKVILSDQVSLLDGFSLLQVLNDPICLQGKIVGINKLKRIRSMVFLRNNSIFAHGLGSISNEEYGRFKEFVEQLFREFCYLEGMGFEELREQTVWRNPVDSKYYSGLEER